MTSCHQLLSGDGSGQTTATRAPLSLESVGAVGVGERRAVGGVFTNLLENHYGIPEFRKQHAKFRMPGASVSRRCERIGSFSL